MRASAPAAAQLQHPHVVRCVDVVDVSSGTAIVLVMEALSGGELLGQLGALDAYSEDEAARVFGQVGGGHGLEVWPVGGGGGGLGRTHRRGPAEMQIRVAGSLAVSLSRRRLDG